jgi:hypothetical protein
VKKNNIKKTQIILTFLGFFLILFTYFIYPKLNKKIEVNNKGKKIENLNKSDVEEKEEPDDTFLTKVDYKGLTTEGNPYSIFAETATVDPVDQDIVYMNTITARYYYKNGRIVVVTSDNALFNKVTGDIRFQNNIKMIDSDENKLTSENLDMLVEQNYAAAYNNVVLKTKDGQSVIADKIYFDSENKIFKVSMNNKNRNVKMKLIK